MLRTLRSDLLLLDGAKALYPEILSLVEGQLRVGALLAVPLTWQRPSRPARWTET